MNWSVGIVLLELVSSNDAQAAFLTEVWSAFLVKGTLVSNRSSGQHPAVSISIHDPSQVPPSWKREEHAACVRIGQHHSSS